MKESVFFRDLSKMEYQQAWDIQEELLQRNIDIKRQRAQPLLLNGAAQSENMNGHPAQDTVTGISKGVDTVNHLLFVEHFPVYTLGKSGQEEHLLINGEELDRKGIQFFRTNRGGDITFHGEGQIVGYPILDLEKFGTDIGKYLRNLEEVIIGSLAEFGIQGDRSAGETGVWIEAGIQARARKICAIGVRCSRWITMHGFALNVNTDLSYFEHIIPCGIQDKQVTSMKKELGGVVSIKEAKEAVKRNFGSVFGVELHE
ncbi:MAG: lipoyl(octanoyl) transferase LipB [Chitinophagales bacterium]